MYKKFIRNIMFAGLTVPVSFDAEPGERPGWYQARFVIQSVAYEAILAKNAIGLWTITQPEQFKEFPDLELQLRHAIVHNLATGLNRPFNRDDANTV